MEKEILDFIKEFKPLNPKELEKIDSLYFNRLLRDCFYKTNKES